MEVEVLMFAAAREAAGQESIKVVVAETASASDVIAAIGDQLPNLAVLLPSCRLAIDNRYVAGDTDVSSDCEIALIPPVSGG